jgi:hypothetical protein
MSSNFHSDSEEHYTRRLLLALQAMSEPDSLVRIWGLNQFQTALEHAHDLGFSITISRTEFGALAVNLSEQPSLHPGQQ